MSKHKTKLLESPFLGGTMGGRDFEVYPAPSALGNSPNGASYRRTRGIYVALRVELPESVPSGLTIIKVPIEGMPGENNEYLHISTDHEKNFLEAARYAVEMVADALKLYPIWFYDCYRDTHVEIDGNRAHYSELLNARAGHRGTSGIVEPDELKVVCVREATFTVEGNSHYVTLEFFSNSDIRINYGLSKHDGVSVIPDTERSKEEKRALEKAIRPITFDRRYRTPRLLGQSTTFGFEGEDLLGSMSQIEASLSEHGFSDFS